MSSAVSPISRHTTESKKSEFLLEVDKQSSAKTPKTPTVKVDPVRALEPARKKLTTLETQRIMGVLDSTIKNSELITALPSALNNIEDLSIVFTRQIVTLINDYKDIKIRLDEVMSKIDAYKGIRQNRRQELEEFNRDQTLASEDFWTSTKASSSASESRMSEFGYVEYSYSEEEIKGFSEHKDELLTIYLNLSEQLRFSLRCLLVGFRSNPAAVNALIAPTGNWKIKKGPGDIRLLNQLKELKEIMVLKLMTTPTERDEKNSYLRQVNEKDKANRIVVRDLENELSAAIEHKDKEIQDKNGVIRKLQAEIHHTEKLSEDTIRRTKLDMERQKENDEKNSESVCQKLQQEIYQKKTEYNNKLNEGRQKEKEMRRNKFKFETALESDLNKYDSLMTELQNEYESIDAQYTEEKTQLQELEERFKHLKEEYDIIMEEKRIAEERREAAKREEELLTKAVITIQSFWRSYKVRKGVRGKRKGKGKGKKKK